MLTQQDQVWRTLGRRRKLKCKGWRWLTMDVIFISPNTSQNIDNLLFLQISWLSTKTSQEARTRPDRTCQGPVNAGWDPISKHLAFLLFYFAFFWDEITLLLLERIYGITFVSLGTYKKWVGTVGTWANSIVQTINMIRATVEMCKM